jgi:hypothetical protein
MDFRKHRAQRFGYRKSMPFDELPAAVAVSDERMDLRGKQVDSGQQAQRAMTFVLVIPREGRVDAGLGRSGAVVAMAWIPGFSS